MKRLLFLALFVLVFTVTPKSEAADFTVNDAASLIAAITTANSNGEDDVITLEADIVLTAADNTTEGVNGLPSILADGGSSLTIEGNGFTIRRGGAAAFRLMHIATGANVFLNDLTLENGLADAGGLGVMGGAVFTRGQLTIVNSVFSENTADGGNGFGGAVTSATNNLTIRNSSFTGNTASNYGGAIFINDDIILLVGNTFSDNTANFGGAIGIQGGDITLINSTISGNTANIWGGGIHTGFNAAVTMRNNTVTNNTAGTGGGGIYNTFVGTVTLHNNIVAANSAPAGSQCLNDTTLGGTVINADSYNIFGTGGDAGGCPAGATDIVPAGTIGTILSPLADNNGPTLTHALVAGSPALDAANAGNCPADDQRGFLRGFNSVGAVNSPQVGDCDIGSFEFSPDPAYDSTPAVGAALDLGTTAVGTEISTILEIIEVGGAALVVSLDAISGANAGDFTIIGLPTTIGDGNPPQDVAIICTPSAPGLRTARMTFTTNDPLQPTVSYDLECTGDDPLATNPTIVTIPGQHTTVTVTGGDTDFVLKTVDNPLATVGQTVTYTIRARNPKTIPLTQVVVYDVFDERLTDLRLISTTHGAGVFNGNTLTVSGFTLQPDEEGVIVVSARIAALQAGETIPNAAILESPDASVHVSNLALVGASAEGNSGSASQVFIIPGQLPDTGETPFWRGWLLGAGGVLLVVSGTLLFLAVRARRRA